MDGANYWITPLALLPGVALLVMSTAIRFGQLHEELHRREQENAEHRSSQHLLRRARMFRNSLVALYTSTALLAISGSVGGLAEIWGQDAMALVLGIAAVAVGCLAYAAVTLIRESLLLLEVIEEHHERLR